MLILFILVETEIDIIEKSGSQNTIRGSILFGQVLQYDHVGMLMATAPIFVAPGYIASIIQLREKIREQEGSVETDDLILWEDPIRTLYFSIYDSMFTPSKLVNTDGNPLVIHDIYYEIDSGKRCLIS